MTTTETILVLVGLAVLIVVAVLGWLYLRHQALKRQFGPEYDRVASEKDTIQAAEQELRGRTQRHSQLQLRELSEQSRQQYTEQWKQLQLRFIDAPDDAVNEADQLVSRLIAECGYPTSDFDEQAALLSVEHSQTLGHYRAAHQIAERHARGEASTEESRQAIVHYRALVADLLGASPTPTPTSASAKRSRHDA